MFFKDSGTVAGPKVAVSKFALFSYKQLNSDVNLEGFIQDPAPTFLLV